jgi:hypothetical protein
MAEAAADGQLLGAGRWIGDREFAIGDQVLAFAHRPTRRCLNGDGAVVVGFDSQRRDITA